MRILLTNSFLATRTGSEMVVRDYALSLQARGHDVSVFATVLSRAWRDEFTGYGMVATDAIGDAPARPDVIHGQHTPAILPAIERFPDTPVVQWIHDRTDIVDTPLRHPSVAHYVAVDESRARRARRAGVDADRVSVIHNMVDLLRFPFRAEPSDEPRALCIVKRAGLEATIDMATRAAERSGWTLDVEGVGVDREIEDMAQVLPRYSLVLTSGRCALEALSSGAAVVVTDDNRMAGLAARENWAALRHDNLGLDAMTEPVTADRLTDILTTVDLRAARAFAADVRSDIDHNTAADTVAALYDRVARTHAPILDAATRGVWRDDIARLVDASSAQHLAHWRRLAALSDARTQPDAD